MIDFNRIAKIIKKTKDKVIVATDDDMLVVMDMDQYEELIANKPTVTESAKSAKTIGASQPETKFSGPISVKEIITDKKSISGELSDVSIPGPEPIQDEEDEYYFEEVDE